MHSKKNIDKQDGTKLETGNMNQPSGLRAEVAPIKKLTLRGQRTRQKILEAAEVIFGERGYEGASISEITRLANVGQGTFYLYFEDKRAVFVELVKNLSRLLRHTLSQAVSNSRGRLAVERDGLKAFFDFVRQHKNLYRIVRQAEFVDPELYRWYYREMAKGYASGLAKAMQKGEIREVDPEGLAYCLMGIGDFLGMRWVLWEDRDVPPEVFETAMTLIQHGLDIRPPKKEGR